MPSTLQYLSITCILLVVSGTVSIEATSYCWNFNAGTEGWFNSGGHDWTHSSAGTPITPGIPFTPSPTPYLWFESVMISPATGIINSPSIPIITVNNGDVIEMSVFSHTSGTNPRNYPTLNFVSDQGSTTMQILESATNDAWHRVSAICGVTATCCRTYPCSGYFSLEGASYSADDLYAVDFISQNDSACI